MAWFIPFQLAPSSLDPSSWDGITGRIQLHSLLPAIFEIIYLRSLFRSQKNTRSDNLSHALPLFGLSYPSSLRAFGPQLLPAQGSVGTDHHKTATTADHGLPVEPTTVAILSSRR